MAKKRTTHQREADLALINRWYIAGWTQQQIADELDGMRPYKVSQKTISNDIKALQTRWQEQAARELDEAKAEELARIDQLEREYWTQYELSKQDQEIVTKKARDTGGKGKGYEVITRTETRTGNPAYLQGIERCIKLRMDLLGLGDEKADDRGPIQVIFQTGMNMDEL
jgi:hypothetical protein